jgi:predicted nucleic acid-binding protein
MKPHSGYVKTVTGKVVDASAVAAMVFLETRARDVDQRLDGCSLYAPFLLPFEMMNICIKKIRARPDQRGNALRGFANYRRAAIELRDVNQDRVVETAEHYGLSAYDASYLWLARDLGIELVTLDDKLAKAAARVV